MQRFKDVLFSPVGRRGNPAALRRVVELVERNEAKLSLLGVAPEPSRLQRMLHRPAVVDAVADAERERLNRDLRRWLAAAPVEADIIVDLGDAALRIIERVVAQNHDLVIVTTDEDREDHATIRRLLRKCPCAVWVIRPTRARVQRVLAAVNPDPGEVGLNRTILELASSMVELYGGELHVVHAWELYGESTMRRSTFMEFPPGEIDAMLAEESARHGEALEEILVSSQPADAPWQVHLVKGPAAEVVPALVDKGRINLLVMGTVARTGVNAMVMGNTAERILDKVNCSVIAVKPPGFVSPIQARHSDRAEAHARATGQKTVLGGIIVPLDGSPDAARALGPAAVLAGLLDIELRAVAFTRPDTHSAVEDALAGQIADLGDVTTSVLVEQSAGPVADDIAALAEADRSALVCMTTAGEGRTAALTGSVATSLLRKIPGPVLLIGPKCDIEAFRPDGLMVVTVDRSDRSEAILPIAESWAAVFDFEPEIVTVIRPRLGAELRAAGEADLVGGMALDSVMVRRIARTMESVIDAPVAYEALHGAHPAEEIVRHARMRKAAVVAMATHGETGVNRLVFGSIAADVVRNAECPVLMIRPPNLF